MPHVFISYSHQDTDMVKRVRDSLRAAGLEVWTDEKLTPGTQSWKNSIERAIEEAACLVVLLSPDSKHSDSVERELDYANTMGLTIFPVLIRGDKRSAVPFELVTTQWVDIRDAYDAGIKQLSEAIRIQMGIAIAPAFRSEPSSAGHTAESGEIQERFTKAIQGSHWDIAIDLGEKLLMATPDDSTARSMLAKAYWQYGGTLQVHDGMFDDNANKQSLALESLNKALQLDPNQSDFYFSRGMLHKRLRNLDAAEADFQKASGMGHARAKVQLSRLRQ